MRNIVNPESSIPPTFPIFMDVENGCGNIAYRKKPSTYLIRKWSEYNASLKKRGSGAIRISSEATANWTTDELTGEPGASPTYTDLAIETMDTVQAFYGLAGRQTQGFLV